MPKNKPAPAPPPKELCRCAQFCLEDTEHTGRYCKLAALHNGERF